MTIAENYLRSLQNKIFKLLPMREAYEIGENNHLKEYIDNLCLSYAGAISTYPEFVGYREIAEVQANLAALRLDVDGDFSKWRSTVLRSTRLIHTVLIHYYGEV